MTAITKLLAGGAAAAALFGAAPAAAQYYPGYQGYQGYPAYPGNPGYGYGGNQPYGGAYGEYNNQALVNQCAASVQQRLSGGYGGYGDGYGGGYGGGRVLGISRVEPRAEGGFTVRGVATSGRAYDYGGYGGQGQVDLTWKCRTDYRGFIVQVDVNRAQPNYGYDRNYSPYDNDYSQYGYHRY